MDLRLQMFARSITRFIMRVASPNRAATCTVACRPACCILGITWRYRFARFGFRHRPKGIRLTIPLVLLAAPAKRLHPNSQNYCCVYPNDDVLPIPLAHVTRAPLSGGYAIVLICTRTRCAVTRG